MWRFWFALFVIVLFATILYAWWPAIEAAVNK